MKYQVHFGVELPFWLALPNGTYGVKFAGVFHRLNLDSDVDRVDIGDFYLGKGALGQRWVPTEFGEVTRRQLEQENPGIPITRHKVKTMVTHVREVESKDETSLRQAYGQRRQEWYAESLAIFEKLIDAFMVSTDDPVQVGPVSTWDLRRLLASFWETDADGNPIRQVSGIHEYVRPEIPKPASVDESTVETVRQYLESEVEIPLMDVLHAQCRAQIERGAYRGAIIDDVAAGELAIALALAALLEERLPQALIDDIVRQRFDDLPRYIALLGGADLASMKEWSDFRRAREVRQRLVHRGVARATKAEAELSHRAAGAVIKTLRATSQAATPPTLRDD